MLISDKGLTVFVLQNFLFYCLFKLQPQAYSTKPTDTVAWCTHYKSLLFIFKLGFYMGGKTGVSLFGAKCFLNSFATWFNNTLPEFNSHLMGVISSCNLSFLPLKLLPTVDSNLLLYSLRLAYCIQWHLHFCSKRASKHSSFSVHAADN